MAGGKRPSQHVDYSIKDKLEGILLDLKYYYNLHYYYYYAFLPKVKNKKRTCYKFTYHLANALSIGLLLRMFYPEGEK